jgi:hypothetical protein
MKAIYINLDPYIAAFAAWIKGGKSGPAPSFDPLPVAVTIPLGETAAIYLNGYAEDESGPAAEVFGSGDTMFTVYADVGEGENIVENVVPALSSFIPGAHYYVRAVAGDSIDVTVTPGDADGDEYPFTIRVLVRRETASGPVDLVDFTPPASAIAAGTDLKGATFDGNEIVAAAETGALSAPAGA